MIFGGRRGSPSPEVQLGRLQAQLVGLVGNRIVPAVSEAASNAAAAIPVQRVLSLLPLLTQYAAPLARMVLGAKEEAREGARQATAAVTRQGRQLGRQLEQQRWRRHGALARWKRRVRRVALAGVTLGVAYAAYRLSRGMRGRRSVSSSGRR